jgi:glucosamine--fructose-6-phosphate aminotransferase (isomerizing)
MCGIVGYIGDKDALPILIEGLRRLEYRGYDSVGIAIIPKDKIVIKKCKGNARAAHGYERASSPGLFRRYSRGP